MILGQLMLPQKSLLFFTILSLQQSSLGDKIFFFKSLKYSNYTEILPIFPEDTTAVHFKKLFNNKKCQIVTTD